jgi:hypothetical protein
VRSYGPRRHTRGCASGWSAGGDLAQLDIIASRGRLKSSAGLERVHPRPDSRSMIGMMSAIAVPLDSRFTTVHDAL